MAKIVYMMNLKSAKSHLSPPFCQVTFVNSTLCDCEYVCHAPTPPHALTQKKFTSTPTLHNGKTQLMMFVVCTHEIEVK